MVRPPCDAGVAKGYHTADADRCLEIWGATVSLAGTATAACAAALAFRPEVIVSGAGFASAEWHPVVRLLGDAPPAVLVWKETARAEDVADLALRLYAGSRD